MKKLPYIALCLLWLLLFTLWDGITVFWPAFLIWYKIEPVWDQVGLAVFWTVPMGIIFGCSAMGLAYLAIEVVRWVETPEELAARAKAENEERNARWNNDNLLERVEAAEIRANGITEQLKTHLHEDWLARKLNQPYSKRPDAKLFEDINNRLTKLEEGRHEHMIENPVESIEKLHVEIESLWKRVHWLESLERPQLDQTKLVQQIMAMMPQRTPDPPEPPCGSPVPYKPKA